MRRRAVMGVVMLLVLGAVAAPAVARQDVALKTTGALINEAYERGALTNAEMILEKAYAVYAPWKLRPEFRGGSIDKCGVPLVEEIERALPSLPQEVANEIRGLRARPTTQTYVDTARFRIHYDTSGTHKILNWPDTRYRDAIMVAAENCWTQEVTNLGFRQPPSDGGDPDGGGGNGLYDIYVQSLGNVYGVTYGSYLVPSTPQNDATSYIVIDNDYAGFGYPDPVYPMQVTVAHEFCHACQYAHDYQEAVWYKECTSTWMEDVVYDYVNDYVGYIPYFYNSPYRSLDYNDGNVRIYGSCVWNFLLSERNTNDVVVDIWYQLEGSQSVFDGTHAVLAAYYGTTIEEEFTQFSIWNWFTNARFDGAHYQEAAGWPLILVTRSYTTYPIVDGAPAVTYKPDHMAANYIRFDVPSGAGDGLRIYYDGPSPSTVPSSAFVNSKLVGGMYGEYGAITLGMMGNGEIIVNDWDLMDECCLVVANLTDNVEDMTYTYDVDEVDTGIEDGVHVFGLRPASPNPFANGTSISYTVPAAGGFVEVGVYDVAGREVARLVSQELPGGDFVARWDGRDGSGEKVASGVYFATLRVGGRRASEKIVALR